MASGPQGEGIPVARLEVQGDGVTLRGDGWGDPAAPSVLLLHGGGQTRHSWAGTAAALAERGWYALAFDLRGHGESGWAPRAEYGIDAFVADTVALARGLAPQPVLVGASLGGVASLLAHAEHGVGSGLVLVDIAPRIEPEGVERIVDFMTSSPDGFASLEEAADAVASYRRNRARPRDPSGLRKNLRRGEDGRYRWHWDPAFLAGPGQGADRREHVHDRERLLAACARVHVPTLLVRGRESDVVSPDGADEFTRAVPHARFADVSEAGHMVAGDRNDAFTDAVAGFLADL